MIGIGSLSIAGHRPAGSCGPLAGRTTPGTPSGNDQALNHKSATTPTTAGTKNRTQDADDEYARPETNSNLNRLKHPSQTRHHPTIPPS